MKIGKLGILFLLVFSANIYGQYPINPTPEQNRAIDRQRREQERRRQAEAYARLRDIDARRYARTNAEKGLFSPGILPKPTEKDRHAIAVADDLAPLYREFLKQKNTGIVRLHDASGCNEEKFVINVDSACPNAYPEKATTFSFRIGKYQWKPYSDIFLENSKLHVKGKHILGFLTVLGEQSLEDLNLSSDGVKQLSALEAPQKLEDFQELSKKVTAGAEIGSRVYNTNAQLKTGQTYLLRVIAYKLPRKTRDGKRLNVSAYGEDDKRDDVTVVFKAVREDSDKSWTLLWKELARKNTPKIVF